MATLGLYYYYYEGKWLPWDFIIIIIIIIIIDRLIALAVSMSDYWSWGRGFDPRHFYKF